jgi:Ca2+-binding EF-hand superfamily protein
MLEANCGSGADQRAGYDLVKLLSRARSAETNNGYTTEKWNANEPDSSLFSNIEPLAIRSEYKDPVVWNSKSYEDGVQYSNTSKRSPVNRRGSITQRFASITSENGWNRSMKVPLPEAVPSGCNDLNSSTRVSRQATADRLANPIAMVKQRLRGAAYFNGRQDWRKLFRYYDRDNSGAISQSEFISLMRRDGRVTKYKMSDAMLTEIFTQRVDADGSSEVSHKEFVDWVTQDEAIQFKAKKKKQFFASKETFQRLSSPESFTGVTRRAYEDLAHASDTESTSPASVSVSEDYQSLINRACSSTGTDQHNHISARLVESLSRAGTGGKPLVFSGASLRTPTAALGRSSEEEYEKGILETKHLDIPTGGSSGYGRVSPLTYASPSPVQKASGRFDTAMSSKKKVQSERTKSRRTATRKRLASPVNVVKAKLKAAAYDRGGTNYEKLFKHYDRDNSGNINAAEFISLMRRDAKLTPRQMEDAKLMKIFTRCVDVDGSGEVSQHELQNWIEDKDIADAFNVRNDTMKSVMASTKKKSISEIKSGIVWSPANASSGYGVTSSTKMSSPAQRRMSAMQGWVVPRVDSKTIRGRTKTSPIKTTPRRHEKRRSMTREMLKNPLAMIKQKIRAAAYTAGGTDYFKLFRYYDRDNSGHISTSEFVSMVRRDGKIRSEQMSTAKLESLFRKSVDIDGSGAVSHEEFITWVTCSSASASASTTKDTEKNITSTSMDSPPPPPVAPPSEDSMLPKSMDVSFEVNTLLEGLENKLKELESTSIGTGTGL